MSLSEAIRNRIKFYQEKKDMSLWGLFKASGVPMSTLAAFMNGITITEFFENDIFKEVEQD